MYSASDLFRKAYAYCAKKYDQVAILSAKYGLLFSDDEIEPYDLTLKNMRAAEVKAWSEKVFEQINQRLNLQDFNKIFFHAGKKYREHLMKMLEDLALECEAPLKNLSIGKQLSWYKTQKVNNE